MAGFDRLCNWLWPVTVTNQSVTGHNRSISSHHHQRRLSPPPSITPRQRTRHGNEGHGQHEKRAHRCACCFSLFILINFLILTGTRRTRRVRQGAVPLVTVLFRCTARRRGAVPLVSLVFCPTQRQRGGQPLVAVLFCTTRRGGVNPFLVSVFFCPTQQRRGGQPLVSVSLYQINCSYI